MVYQPGQLQQNGETNGQTNGQANGDTDTGNPVVEVGLLALPGDWTSAIPPFDGYLGLYHLMQDGTAVIGEGVLGEELEINLNDVITYIGFDGAETEGTFNFPYLNITNLNPSRGDVSVNGSTVPAEGFSHEYIEGEEDSPSTAHNIDIHINYF